MANSSTKYNANVSLEAEDKRVSDKPGVSAEQHDTRSRRKCNRSLGLLQIANCLVSRCVCLVNLFLCCLSWVFIPFLYSVVSVGHTVNLAFFLFN